MEHFYVILGCTLFALWVIGDAVGNHRSRQEQADREYRQDELVKRQLQEDEDGAQES